MDPADRQRGRHHRLGALPHRGRRDLHRRDPLDRRDGRGRARRDRRRDDLRARRHPCRRPRQRRRDGRSQAPRLFLAWPIPPYAYPRPRRSLRSGGRAALYRASGAGRAAAAGLFARALIAHPAGRGEPVPGSLLRVVTAGSVDDGKSTLVGRLLHDAKAVLTDQLTAVEAASERRGYEGADLALLVDGLRAEREQGITIDVAYRYFATANRTFILADTPGHVQYTRNTVTGASTADVAVILVDARNGVAEQTKRHAAVATLLRVEHVVHADPGRRAVGRQHRRPLDAHGLVRRPFVARLPRAGRGEARGRRARTLPGAGRYAATHGRASRLPRLRRTRLSRSVAGRRPRRRAAVRADVHSGRHRYARR